MIKSYSLAPGTSSSLEKEEGGGCGSASFGSKWRELRPRTPFSDPFQCSGGSVAHIPHCGDWSRSTVNQQKGDGSSTWSRATVRLDARAPMRRELVCSFGASREAGAVASLPLVRRLEMHDGDSPAAQ